MSLINTKVYDDLLKTLEIFINHKNTIIEHYNKDNNNSDILYTKVHLSWYNNLIDLLSRTLEAFNNNICLSCTIRQALDEKNKDYDK